MKVPAKKMTASAKAAVKIKAVPKPAAKAAKTAKVKTAVKPVPKQTAKPIRLVKPAKAIKPAAATKTPVKAAPKAAVKVTVKPRPAAGKGVAKTSKPAAKAVSKKAAAAVKPLPKKIAKPIPELSPKAVKPSEKAAKAVKAPPPAPTGVVRPTERSMVIPAPPALKPGRRSSARALAHMPPPAPMVPTHAPDAAKASYSTITERVIAPPPHVAAKKDPKLANNWKAKSAQELSDEEVKAMPDAEYMNDKQMAFFRHKLSILKQDIHNSAGETTEHLREDTVVVPDPADRATIEEEHALELRTRDRERKLLKKIEQSIARIDSGDYGYCDETGEPIGVGRLIARPTANLSLEAQQRRELKQKMFGD